MGSIDLSVGAIVLLVGAACVKIENGTGSGFDIVLLGILLGALLDCSTLLSSLTGVSSFVVTLGSFSIFSRLALQILQGRAITFNSAELDVLAIGEWIPPLQNIALCGITVWMAGVLISRHTRFGRYIYLIGGGEAVARNSGIPVGRYKIYAFTLSGLIAGFGGVRLLGGGPDPPLERICF